jgi:hypothetical protein
MTLKIKYTILLIVLLVLAESSFSQSVNHWETIVQTGDNCKYYIPKSNIGSSWKAKDFSDGGWITAQSGVGYGDGDDNTTISNGVNSIYIRYSFNIENKAKISSLILDMDYDDGFIAYLNGTEVARDNVSNPVTWNMKLRGLHEAALYKGERPERFSISSFKDELLVNGKNVLAIVVHH